MVFGRRRGSTRQGADGDVAQRGVFEDQVQGLGQEPGVEDRLAQAVAQSEFERGACFLPSVGGRINA